MTITVKKDFVALVQLLEENKNKKVSDVMSKVLELVSSNKKPTTYKKDENGNVTHIFCYYHKEWEPVELYGKKASSNTGYNTMCKEGVNQWTKRQKMCAKLKTDVLMKVQQGEISPDEIQAELDKIEQLRTVIIPRSE